MISPIPAFDARALCARSHTLSDFRALCCQVRNAHQTILYGLRYSVHCHRVSQAKLISRRYIIGRISGKSGSFLPLSFSLVLSARRIVVESSNRESIALLRPTTTHETRGTTIVRAMSSHRSIQCSTPMCVRYTTSITSPAPTVRERDERG